MAAESVSAIMKELAAMGSEQARKTFARHSANIDMFGVRVGDMKTIVKRIKKDYELAKALYATGNSDAMYLAGLIADEDRMTPADLDGWMKAAPWYMIAEYTVPWVAADSPHGWILGNKWIDSNDERIAAGGWATLSSVLSVTPDDKLDLQALKRLLARVADSIGAAKNRERYCMNGFVIAVGCFVAPLSAEALKTARAIGKVEVDMGDTSCKVPDAAAYIRKLETMGRVGRKKKTARC